MNEDAMKKVYFAHRKVIKRWETQMEEKPVKFEDGKKVRTPDPDIEPDSMEADVAHEMEAEEPVVDINNVDDIIKNFVKRPQGSVDDIIKSV